MSKIKEHDMVRLMHAKRGLPENAIGTVVHIHGKNEGYEVEFFVCPGSKYSMVKTLMPDEIERIPDGRSQ